MEIFALGDGIPDYLDDPQDNRKVSFVLYRRDKKLLQSKKDG